MSKNTSKQRTDQLKEWINWVRAVSKKKKK